MIDYIKLYSELQLIIIVEYFFRYYDNEDKRIVYIFGIIGVILISVGTSFFIDKKNKPAEKEKALKYNVKNVENLGKNIEILEKEFEFLANKEEQINKTLTEFYKPSGIIIDKKIMEKLKN